MSGGITGTDLDNGYYMIPHWTHIVIHHSFTQDGKTVSWDDIRRFHMTDPAYMFNDIGYNGGIELIDNEYIVLAGRPLNVKGAHCKEEGMNSKAIGFCFVGNYDLIAPPITMLVKGASYIKGLMDIFGIIPANVRGHRDYATYKSCPGRKFDMSIFRDLLR